MSILQVLSVLDQALSRQISEKIRLCPICQRKAESRRFLCRHCARFCRDRQYRQWVRFQDGIPVLSLFEWTEKEHAFFQCYAHALKGGGERGLYRSIAADLLALRAQLRKPIEKNGTRDWVIIPAPGRGGSRDHAEELAAQIAELAGARFCPCLERLNQKSQKALSLSQRQVSATLRLSATHSPEITDEKLYIWVDDVITTGSTANFAYHCLGRPRHFEIWTIFNRPRLRADG